MSEKIWRVHAEQILSGGKKSTLALTLELIAFKRNKRRGGLGFVNYEIGNSDYDFNSLNVQLQKILQGNIEKAEVMDDFNKINLVDDMILQLKAYTKDMTDYQVYNNNTKIMFAAPEAERERELFKLGLILCEAGRFNHVEVLNEYIDAGYPINFQHPYAKKTALHRAVGNSAAEFARAYIDCDQADLLIRDDNDNLAYDIAYVECEDIDLTFYLEEKTKAQAVARGLNLATLFKPHSERESLKEYDEQLRPKGIE